MAGRTESKTYEVLNKAWKNTCRTLFGEEVGELSDFEDWLMEMQVPRRTEKSAISGKPVSLGICDYARGAKYLSFEEVEFAKRFEPLSINDMKDMDSVIEALQGRIYYTGNVILGNSQLVEASSNVTDSSFIYKCVTVSDCKYVACSALTRSNEYSFGTFGDGLSSHIIRCGQGHNNRRCFECYSSPNCSDCYYCSDSADCQNCIFCFGARSKSFCIGNTQLPKEKCLSLKAKLLSEISAGLKREKRVFSIFDIIGQAAKFRSEKRFGQGRLPERAGDKKVVEEAFARTSSILLGKELQGLDEYAKLLQRHVVPNLTVVSPLSGQKVIVAGYISHILGSRKMEGRVASYDEMLAIGNAGVDAKTLGGMKMDVESLGQLLHRIAYANMGFVVGSNINVMESAEVASSESVYRGNAYAFSKKCAYCFWPRSSEHIFGSSCAFESSFCINCNYSKKLTRCFECDSCKNSSGLYYSHNCENVRDSMFCFNAKNLANAIGNAPLEPETYKNVKSSLVSQIADELGRKKDLKWDIYNIGAATR
jgi:hypothetical protein